MICVSEATRGRTRSKLTAKFLTFVLPFGKNMQCELSLGLAGISVDRAIA
jgi:hypothetical protein